MPKNMLSVFEFDAVTANDDRHAHDDDLSVPASVFAWLETEALRISALGAQPWLRLTQRHGVRAVQFTSFVGVLRAPGGFQIEVLPKVGKAIGGGQAEARQLLIDMLCCLEHFRHVQTDQAKLLAAHMPLWDVFVTEFIGATERVVKRGLHSAYSPVEDNLFALRGKLLMSKHLRDNMFRADRFFTGFDEFTTDRPENRLLHAALTKVLQRPLAHETQKRARALTASFSHVPVSQDPVRDFQRVPKDRSMSHYATALAWARLILSNESPLTGSGRHDAPSLLFPMEAVFEAFVAKHVAKQVKPGFRLKTQVRSLGLVTHKGRDWFRMQPDLVIADGERFQVVLDTKWKLIDANEANGTDKYGLAQDDLYQMHAYGHTYLNGVGNLVLIYPKSDAFDRPLPVFGFPHASGLKLWVLPFCLKQKQLEIPWELAGDDSPLVSSTLATVL